MQELIELYRLYPKYNHLTDAELRLYLMPSIKYKQCKVHFDNNEIIGFTNWAYLSDEAQDRFMKEGYLHPKDWLSGNHLWHIETVCKRDLKQMMKWTKQYFAKKFGIGKSINWLRVDNDSVIRNTVQIHTRSSWL